MEELTSGASGRIIPVFKNLRRSVLSYQSLRRSFIFIQSIFFWFILLLRRHRLSPSSSPPPSPSSAAAVSSKRKFVLKREEEDILRRRALAEGLKMVTGDGSGRCEWTTSLFYGVRGNALFCRSWLPVAGETK